LISIGYNAPLAASMPSGQPRSFSFLFTNSGVPKIVISVRSNAGRPAGPMMMALLLQLHDGITQDS
jgi:hypothetical protein